MSVNYASLPFEQQIAFFKAKLPYPTEFWNALSREMHDTAFVIAGATKADMLADMQAALEKAMVQGTTLAEFRKDFSAIVKKSGWTGWTGEGSKTGVAWRTRVIYDTNLRTAYQAGRWQQIQAVKKHRPYLQYRHSHSSVSPRPQHLAWDGLVVPVDSDWARTHFPPNGFGCKCRMFALSDSDLQKMGKDGPDTPPDSGTYTWKDPKTGETHRFPDGIDPYFDYTPGASLLARATGMARRKAEGLPPAIARQLLAAFPAFAEELRTKRLGVGTVDYAGRDDIGVVVNAAFSEFKQRGLPLPNNVKVDGDLFKGWANQNNVNPEDLAAAFAPDKSDTATYLFVNPLYRFWGGPKTDAAAQNALGAWSTDNAYHTINHEQGHFLHYLADSANYRALQFKPLSETDKRLAAKVSHYAQVGAGEFVAEVLAALLDGKAFGNDIMSLYKSMKGPNHVV